MDFTIKTYKKLINNLLNQGYSFQPFFNYIEKPLEKSIVLRHDVDKLPENSLRFAQIQHELGIKGSYYFRIVPESLPAGQASFNPAIIQEIARLGHEIGYHYEDIDFAMQNLKIKDKSLPAGQAGKKTKEEFEKKLANEAIVLFEKHLIELRKYYPVKTICMHGSPLSKYDNKMVWKYYNYRDYGITGEPYFDVDFSNVLYLTDTGRRWNGEKVSIRDKVKKERADTTLGHKRENSDNFLRSPQPPEGDSPLRNKGVRTSHNKTFKNTFDIIKAAENGELPDQIMFTFHPQRWTDKPFPWVKELTLQNAKNSIKYFLNIVRS